MNMGYQRMWLYKSYDFRCPLQSISVHRFDAVLGCGVQVVANPSWCTECGMRRECVSQCNPSQVGTGRRTKELLHFCCKQSPAWFYYQQAMPSAPLVVAIEIGWFSNRDQYVREFSSWMSDDTTVTLSPRQEQSYCILYSRKKSIKKQT